MRKIPLALAVACACAATGAAAVDLAPGLSLKGFGTIGVVNSSTDQADFSNSSNFEPNGAGRSARTSFTPDSRAGVQLDWKALDKLTLVAQFLSKNEVNSSFAPVLEWAYAKYAVTGDLDVRVGRIRPPVYMLSDYIDVNYANPWVRPPVEFYATAAIDRMDGLDLLWRPSVGDYTFLLQPFFGVERRNNLAGGAGTVQAHDLGGLNATATYGNTTLRAGYLQEHFQVFTPGADLQVFPLLSTICGLTHGADATACSAYSNAQADDRLASFVSFGFNWDNGDYFVSGEGGKRTLHSWVADLTSWYVSGGRRFGKWTPYATYSSASNDSPTSVTSGLFPGLPAFGLPSTNTLLTALQLANSMDQHTVTLGVRYDLSDNLALKGQWDHITTATRNGQPGTGEGFFGNATPAFSSASNSVDLVSLSLDFVF